MENFAQRVRQLRKESGKTQTQMAEIMGISRQMLSYKLKSILNKMREMYMNKFF